MPPRPVSLLEQARTDLGGDPPGDFAHGSEQGQVAFGGLHGLVSDAGRLGLEQRLGYARVRRQVEVREQHEVIAKEAEFRLLGFFHLADELSRPCLFGAGHRCACCLEVLVAERRPEPGARLHAYLVAGGGQLAHAVRRHGNAILRRLDLGRDSDDHRCSPSSTSRAGGLLGPLVRSLSRSAESVSGTVSQRYRQARTL